MPTHLGQPTYIYLYLPTYVNLATPTNLPTYVYLQTKTKPCQVTIIYYLPPYLHMSTYK